MYTGYWIKNRSIYGPRGYTGYRIDRRRQILGPQGYTRHWIHRDNVYSALEGNTGYWIDDDRIQGPSAELPWEQKNRTRIKRAKSKGSRKSPSARAG